MIKVIIADTQYLIIEAIKSILQNEKGFEVVSFTDNSYSLFESLKKNAVDVIITDWTMMDYESADDFKKLKQDFPNTNILILTNSLNKADYSKLSKVGIKNIILKIADKDEVLQAIEATAKGKKYYSSEILDLLIDISEKKNSINEPVTLTQTEIEIVRLISEGLTTKAIAERKNISFHTVMTHRKNIFRKLEINSSSELLMYAMKAGIIYNLEYYI